MLEAIAKAHEEIKKIAQFIADVQAEIGKPKFSFESQEVDHDMFEAIKDFAIDKVKYALDTDDKNIREERLAPVIEEIHAKFDEQYPEAVSYTHLDVYKRQLSNVSKTTSKRLQEVTNAVWVSRSSAT